MKELELKPEQILVPGEYELGNQSILKIYFRIFDKGYGKDLPPVIVVHNSLVDYNGLDRKMHELESIIKNCVEGYDIIHRDLQEGRIDQTYACLRHNEYSEKVQESNMHIFKIKDIYQVFQILHRLNAEYFLIDGNHRTVAATLTHNPIYALELQNNKDISEARKMIKKGELFNFDRAEDKLVDLVMAWGSYVSGHIDDTCTVKQRVNQLTSNGDLPSYMKQKYLERSVNK